MEEEQKSYREQFVAMRSFRRLLLHRARERSATSGGSRPPSCSLWKDLGLAAAAVVEVERPRLKKHPLEGKRTEEEDLLRRSMITMLSRATNCHFR